MRFGATFPTNIDLQAVLNNAIKDHEVNIVDILLQNGVQPPQFSLMTLIRAYTEQRKKNNASSDLDTRFKCILTTIVHAGADVNFCEMEEIPQPEHELPESDEDDTESDDENTYIKDGLKITTPLNLAARIGGSRNILEQLLLFGADVSAASSETFDPILTAALFGELEDLECLLERALSDPRESHWSIFLGGMSEEANAIVRVCHSLKKANTLNTTNYKGRTLLHLAVEQRKDNLVSTLIAHGARTDILDNERRPAIELAAIARNTHAFEAIFTATKVAESPK
jgi:ankyrin repeat protein